MSGGKLIEARTAAVSGAFIFLIAFPLLAIFALCVTVFTILHHIGECVVLFMSGEHWRISHAAVPEKASDKRTVLNFRAKVLRELVKITRSGEADP